MKRLVKVIALVILGSMLVVSGAAHDVICEESQTIILRDVAEVNGGYCVSCGSMSIQREIYCGSLEGHAILSVVPCFEHDSCNMIWLYAVRFYEDRCRSCGYIQALDCISDDAHLESIEHTSNGQIDIVCTLDGHMT